MSWRRKLVSPESSFAPELFTSAMAFSRTAVPDTRVLRNASSSAFTVEAMREYSVSSSG